MNAETFGDITLASRTLSKCDAIAANVKEKTGVEIQTRKVDATDPVEHPALHAAFIWPELCHKSLLFVIKYQV